MFFEIFEDSSLVTQEKSFHLNKSKYSWCRDAHKPTVYLSVHVPTPNGGMVTPWWPWLRPLCRHPCTPWTRAITPKRKARRNLQDATDWCSWENSHKIRCCWLQERAYFHYVCPYVCVSISICVNNRVLLRDKDAEEPHPSITWTGLKMFCGNTFAWFLLDFSVMWMNVSHSLLFPQRVDKLQARRLSRDEQAH